MTIIYTTAVKTERMTAVRDLIDVAAGNGAIEIGTAGMGTVLAVIPLDAISGTISGSILTFSSFPKSDSSADATGTAAEARIIDGISTNIITGLTVGTSASDIVLDSLSITTGQVVTLDSATITHA